MKTAEGVPKIGRLVLKEESAQGMQFSTGLLVNYCFDERMELDQNEYDEYDP